MWLLYKVFGTKAIQIYIFYGCVCVNPVEAWTSRFMGPCFWEHLIYTARCRRASQHVALQHSYSAVEQGGYLRLLALSAKFFVQFRKPRAPQIHQHSVTIPAYSVQYAPFLGWFWVSHGNQLVQRNHKPRDSCYYHSLYGKSIYGSTADHTDDHYRRPSRILIV